MKAFLHLKYIGAICIYKMTVYITVSQLLTSISLWDNKMGNILVFPTVRYKADLPSWNIVNIVDILIGY